MSDVEARREGKDLLPLPLGGECWAQGVSGPRHPIPDTRQPSSRPRPLAPIPLIPWWQRVPGLPILLEIAKNRQGIAALATIVVLLCIGIGAHLIAPDDPLAMHLAERFAPPSARYWLGTDEFGRDIFSRLLYGGRVSLLAGLVAVAAASSVGIPFGLSAGYFGGFLDSLFMRVVDFMLAIPGIILAMVIVAVIGPNAVNAMIAVAIAGIPSMARLARASTLGVKEKEYVEATRCAGATSAHIMFRTILPNIMTPLVVQFALAAAGAVLLEASLSFLGLGTQPPTPSWGTLLNTGRNYMFNSPWYGIFPGLLITLLVLSLNNLADVIRDVLDPASRRQRARGDAPTRVESRSQESGARRGTGCPLPQEDGEADGIPGGCF